MYPNVISILSKPSRILFWEKSSKSNENAISSHWTVLFSIEISMLVLGVASIFAKSASTFSWLVSIGTRPILIEFNLKISANLVEIIASNPQSCKPQGACSLEEPVPKLSPATKTFDPWYASLFRGKSGSFFQS